MARMDDQQQATGDVAVTPYAAMFDKLSGVYDQSGVPFFGVIAGGLVDRLQVRPGEHALDIGAGRGAVTFRLAQAVGPTGRVDALDLAPGMVRLLAEDTTHLAHVHVTTSDAADPRPPAPPYDLVASSLVLFFLDDPVGALARWRTLLRPGGRVGVTTFQPWWGSWQALSDLYDEFTDDSISTDDRYGTEAGVELMLTGAGFSEVRSELATFVIPFADVAEWERWSWATPLGGLWRRTREADHPEILRRATEILEASRDADGRIALEVGPRYTFGIR
jgi:ubiquinone/menaquinone biosynthesis C-methylase UbiE